LAIAHDKIAIVGALLARGADRNLLTIDGRTALSLATSAEMIALLS